MLENDVLEEVPENELDNPDVYYLAWFSVCTGTGVDGEGKFRIVYNAARKNKRKAQSERLFE